MDMNHINKKLDECTTLLEGSVVYLDYPAYDNVGDILIWMGARKLLERNKINLKAQFGQRLGYRAHKLIGKCDTICFQGGGNFGDLYTYHQNFRESLIKEYPDKRIVVFPQSVHFQDKNNLERSCRTLKEHNDLHIYLRDKNSFDLLHEQGVKNIYLAPDTAHALWPIICTSDVDPSSKLLLLRRDKEDAVLPNDVLAEKDKSFDWEEFLTGFELIPYQFGLQLNRIDGRLMGNMLPAYTVWNWEAQRLMKKAIHLFSPYETIVTNRLHAMILSVLMGKKCIVYDNSYGKLSSYHDLWLKGLTNITFRLRRH